MKTILGKEWLNALNENPEATFYYKGNDDQYCNYDLACISIPIFKDNRKNNIYALYTLSAYIGSQTLDYFDPLEHKMEFVGYYSSSLKKMFNLLPAFTIPFRYFSEEEKQLNKIREFSYDFSIEGIISEIELSLQEKMYNNFSAVMSQQLSNEFKSMEDFGKQYFDLTSTYNIIMGGIEKKDFESGLNFIKYMETKREKDFIDYLSLASNEISFPLKLFYLPNSFIVRDKKDSYDILTIFIKEFSKYDDKEDDFSKTKDIVVNKIAQDIFDKYFARMNFVYPIGEEFKIKSQYRNFFVKTFFLSFVKDYCKYVQNFDYSSNIKYIADISKALNNSEIGKTVEVLLEKENESITIKIEASRLKGKSYISEYEIIGSSDYKEKNLKPFVEHWNEIPLKYVKTISFRKKVYYEK